MTFMPSRRKRAKMGVRVSDTIRCESHLRWVRGHCCLIEKQHECSDRIEAHHVREGHHAMGTKPDDSEAVPLCSAAHAELHNRGAQTFEKNYKLDLLKVAAELWKKSPHGISYRLRDGE